MVSLLAQTPILTDQGLIDIDKITPDNSIEGVNVKEVISYENSDFQMVLFKKDSIGRNIPNQDTLLSQNQDIYLSKHLLKVKHLINNKDITKKVMETQKVYDLIMKQSKPFKLRVNNTLIETITPKLRKKILPLNFDWESYTQMNEDLIHLEKEEAEKHYLRYGQNEDRQYNPRNPNLVPDDFDWKNYTQINPDLQNLNKNEAEKHYLRYGKKEGRQYHSKNYNQLPEDFDWKVYTDLHKDLKDFTEAKAEKHYLRYGRKENRAYNKLNNKYLN